MMKIVQLSAFYSTGSDLDQARRQDSVTGGGGGGGGGRNKFWGAREVYLCEFERGTGAREIYPCLDQTNKVKTEDRRIKGIFRPKSGIQAAFLAENR